MLEVHNLVCHRDVSIALICLKSLLATSQEKLQIVVHDDGSLTDEDKTCIRAQLPDSILVSRDQADHELAIVLDGLPTIRKARLKLPHLLKVLDVPMLCRSDNVCFVDSDVLFLRTHRGLFEISKTRSACARFMLDIRTCHGFRLKDFGPWVLFPQLRD
jgi:alpha-N-acetylglucosamine transferase